MYSELYELERKKTRYRNLRDNFKNASNILTNVSFKDDMNILKSSVSKNCKINDISDLAAQVTSCSQLVANVVEKLNTLYNSSCNSIYRLDNEINNYEEE